MFCTNCGKQLPDGAQFCTECGASLAVDQNAEKQKKRVRAAMRRKNIIATLVTAAMLLAVIVGGVMYFMWYNSAEQKVIRALENGDFSGAVDIMDDNISLRTSEELATILSDRIDRVKQNFADGTMDYAALQAELDTIERMKVEAVGQKLEQLRQDARALNESRTHFAAAEELFAAGSYLAAMEHYVQVIEADADYENAQRKLTEATDQYRQEILDSAKAYADRGDYTEALSVLEGALAILPQDSRISQQIIVYQNSHAEQQKADTLAAAAQCADAGDYAGAVALLQDYLDYVAEDADISRKLVEYQSAAAEKARADVLAEAAGYAAAGDYVKAMETLERYANTYGSHGDITAAYNVHRENYVNMVLAQAQAMADDPFGAMEFINAALKNVADDRLTNQAAAYEAAYVDSVVQRADALAAQLQADEAVALVTQALERLPDNDVLTAKLQTLQTAKPVPLSTLSPINGGFGWNEGSPADPFGNTYNGVQNYAIFHAAWSSHSGEETYSAEYKVDEKYDCLSFVVSPYSDFSENATSYIQVYVDNVLRYTSPRIDQKTEPMRVSGIDISDAAYVKIVVHVGSYGCLMLSDVMLNTIPGFVSKLDPAEQSLSALETFNGSLNWENEFPTDSRNGDYTHAHNYSVLHSNWASHSGAITHSAEYYIAGTYSSISLDVAPAAHFGQSGAAVVKIYVDDVLAYTSQTLTQKTTRFNTGAIDLTGADYVKIVVELEGYSCTIISNVLLKIAA